MKSVQAYVYKHWFWLLAMVGGAIPLAQLSWGLWQDRWIDPVAETTSRTGSAAILMLVLSLACTPVNTLLGFRQAVTARKPLGLYAFLYASLHLLNFIGIDYGFSLRAFLDDALLQKRFMIVGFAAFLILLPLAITSTKGWMKRLGRNWKRLHQLVYLAGIFAVLHYLWLVKIDITQPLIYGGVLALLLVLRLPVVRQWVSRLRPKVVAPERSQVAKAGGKKSKTVVTMS
jgi:methionine sulfoxide reductase heme-binding subunit